ncbi:MAG: hypothetical protein HQK92_12730 [Nitrospirae bacterium]|nr:hypothetical protein [Nitrospirota bacterium]
MLDIDKHIQGFIKLISSGDVEVYNEFSLQHELGIYLREHVIGHKVQFERNVVYFNCTYENFEKKEIDISIFNEGMQDKYAIELKFPRNGQHPVQMYSSCVDICFLEQLVFHCGFTKCYFLMLVDDPLFYSNDNIDTSGIYAYFRNGKELSGSISKPIKNLKGKLKLQNSYYIKWYKLKDDDVRRYALVIVNL